MIGISGSLASVVAVVAFATAACTHRAARGDSNSLRGSISADDIAVAGATSAYEIIARLRPHFLRDRGPTTVLGKDRRTATVFLDDVEYGSLEALRQMPVDRLREIRFFAGTDAVSRFGAAYHGGVIQLLSRYD